jgi:pyridoxamine 5'-phosphate oxidase
MCYDDGPRGGAARVAVSNHRANGVEERMTQFTSLISRINDAIDRARSAGFELANGFALATVGADNRPSVRVVLLKTFDERGLVFYTNLESRKSLELQYNPWASACFWWPQLQEQVRVEGRVEPVPDDEADAYFATRPRGSQLGAWASRQSQPLDSREALIARFFECLNEYKDRDIPRPPFWSGYRLVPDSVEFWYNRDDRLHERLLYTRRGDLWSETILQP